MKFNPKRNILHFIHYKLTSNLFKQTEIYYTSEFSSRIAVGGGLWGITFFIIIFLRNKLRSNDAYLGFLPTKIENESAFLFISLISILLTTFLLFRLVKFKTFWKIHKSITKSKVYYYQLRRKFILQFLGIVIVFFVIRALLKFYYPN
ncbi:MAG: hypothetical protein GW761_06540 [Leptospira sp.]|nr:hypothetical protein [Leptospira sp.]